MENNPLISVIIPTYNRRYFLEKISVPSVLRQTYTNFQLIIVDDHSTDDTGDFVKSLSKKDKRIKYVKNFRKKGVSGARNSGILVSNGKYISFLDDDDEWIPEHLERLLNILKRYPEIDIISAAAKMVDFLSKKIIRYLYLEEYFKTPGKYLNGFYLFDKDLFYYSIDGFFICNTLAMLVKKSVFNFVIYPENLSICEDCFLVHSMAYKGFQFAFYPKVHRVWYVHGQNTIDFSKKNPKKMEQNSFELIKYYQLILDSFDLSLRYKKKILKNMSDVFFWHLGYNVYLPQGQYKNVFHYYLKGLLLDPSLLKVKSFLAFLLLYPFRFLRRKYEA